MTKETMFELRTKEKDYKLDLDALITLLKKATGLPDLELVSVTEGSK